ncbi:lysine 2,3-aminomutase [Streptomyces sp. NPDC005251]|uniref:KamA family radical SAM protein n=1 Tax=Streptomyces sp. NPDC005251 TaxID=3157166 RepID=UPI0033BD8F12
MSEPIASVSAGIGSAGRGRPSAPRFRAFTARDLDTLAKRAGLSAMDQLALRAVAAVLPFRTNSYVVDELIDWSRPLADPVFRLTFPQPGMLSAPDLARMTRLVAGQAPSAEVRRAANAVRAGLNPHPAGQLDLNGATLDGRPVPGVQHKYAETALVFPRQGQTCHAYCTYCFRWPQFVGQPELRIATDDADDALAYVRAHPEITSVLLTGGDPLVMTAEVLRRYIEPLLEIDSVQSVRVGTRALTFWPYRFVTDPDADALLRLFAKVVQRGRHLAVVVHLTHPQELRPEIARTALRRILDTGAVVRCQGPVVRGINDDPAVWAELWNTVTRLGAVPYYQFVERDTGPRDYFAVPLVRAYEIFRDAYAQVSGLARTVRGPVMSTTAGKVCVDGAADIAGTRVLVLHLVQARVPDLVGRPFFAAYDPTAIWLTDLRPAFGAEEFLPGLPTA